MHYLHAKTTLYDKNYFNDSGKLSGKQPIKNNTQHLNGL